MRLKVLLLGGAVGVLTLASAGPLMAQTTTTYTYDVHGRLVVVKQGTAAQTAYAYDPADNRSQKVTVVSGAPAATTDYITTAKNTAVTFDPRANDVDADTATLTITAHGTAGHGTVSHTTTAVTYTPTTGYSGADTFTYTVSDGTSTSVGTVNVNVDSGNRPPNAGPDRIRVPKNVGQEFDVKANDSDPDGDFVTIIAKTDGVHGTVFQNLINDRLSYTPATGYEGGDSFTYTISDSKGGAASTTVVVAVNSTPVAVNDTVTTDRNVAKVFDPRVNDTDANFDPLTITAIGTGGGAPSHGTTVINSGTGITYTPTTGYSGSDSFTYTVSDGLATASGTVSVTVGANAAPVANADTLAVTYNTATTFDPRVNDTDPNGDTFTITAKTNGAHGAVIINSGTGITYTPTTGYTGTDSFTYTITDAGSATATATVTVTVASTNHAPVAVNDSITTSLNSAQTFNPRANDTDFENNPLTIVSKTDGAHGTVAIVSSGTQLTYTPATGYSGTDSFTYTISDGMGGGDSTATVSVTVSSSTNSAPIAVGDTMDAIAYYSGPTTRVRPVGTIDPRVNDSDPDSDTLTVTSVTQPALGTVTFTSGSVTYSYATTVLPNGAPEFVESDEFTYTISDGHGHTATQTVYVSVRTQ